jgi:hypothetical protein
MAPRIVRSGTWLYDKAVSKPVDIVGLDYDFWYEMHKSDGLLAQGEEPEPFSPEGLLYYARFKKAGDASEPTWVESPGRTTVEAAMRDAQDKVPGPITWK